MSQQFQGALDRIFDRMDLHMPTRHEVVNDITRARRMKVLNVFTYLIPALLFGLMISIVSSWDTQFMAAAVAVGTIVLGAPVLSFHVAGGPSKKSQRISLDRLLCRVENWVGQGAVLLDSEANFIHELSNKNQRVREACVRWAAANASGTLTHRELVCLRRVNTELLVLTDQWKVGQAARDRVTSIQSILNQSNMMDEAASLREQESLQVATEAAPAEVARRTL